MICKSFWISHYSHSLSVIGRNDIIKLILDSFLPTFDKDIGGEININAVETACAKKTAIQIHLWHVEHAFQRTLQERRERSSLYEIEIAQQPTDNLKFVGSNWKSYRTHLKFRYF